MLFLDECDTKIIKILLKGECIMKKRLIIAIFCAIFLTSITSLAFAAEQPWNLRIAYASVGGVWQPMAEGISQLARKYGPQYSNITTVPGGDEGNCLRVDNGELDFAFTYLITGRDAYAGGQGFDKKYENFRAVSNIHPAITQFFILKDTDITSIDQIAEKQFPLSIGINRTGSMMDKVHTFLLNTYGLDEEKVNNWKGKFHRISMTPTWDLMSNKEANAIVNTMPFPDSSVVEFSMTHDLNMLPIKEEIVDKMIEKFGGDKETIPAGTYSFLKEDIIAFRTWGILIVNKNVDEEIVYKLTKAIAENIDYLGSVHKQMGIITPLTMGIIQGIPLHPGAEKYYKEIGAF